jgi:tetratricopeptide (TPR) repeat protein
MNDGQRHVWVTAPSRAQREDIYKANLNRQSFFADCHQVLRGPYSGTSDLLGQLVDQLYKQCSQLVERHSVELLQVAPFLHRHVQESKESLTTQAAPSERTRFYASGRTERVAHGVIDFLLALTAEEHAGPYAVVFENVQAADELDRELLRMLMRRADPARLQVVIASEEQGLDEALSSMFVQQAERWDAPTAEEHLTVAETEDADRWHASLTEDERAALGRAFVFADCATDDAKMRIAYERADESLRQTWHDERFTQMPEEEREIKQQGALLLHQVRGSDARGAGLKALRESLLYCVHSGFYHGTIERAVQARSLMGFSEEHRIEFWTFTSKLVLALIGLDRLEEAEEICIEAQTLTADAYVQMSAVYFRSMLHTRYFDKKDFMQAKAFGQLAVALAQQMPDPKERAFSSVFYQNGLALVEMRLGNMERALTLVREGHARLEQVLEPHEHLLHRSVLLYNSGQILSRMEQYEEALEVYDKVIAIDPNYPDYHFGKGNILSILGRTDEAIACYTRALAVSPPFPEVYHNRALLLKQQGRLNESLTDYDYLLVLDPDDLEALAHRVDILCEREAWDLARRDTEHALRLDPQHSQLLCKLGLIEMAEGHSEAAVAAFTSSLAEKADYLEAWTNRAVARYELGDIEGAIADLTEALLLGENATVLYNRAWAHQSLEKWDDAIADYSEALTLPDADAMDIYYQRGVCLLAAGREEDGMADLKRHLQLAEGESPYQEEIAQVAPTLVS